MTPERWDDRLTARGISFYPAEPSHNTVWRCVMGLYRNQAESGGKHHIFVDVRDEYGRRLEGVPVTFYRSGAEETKRTEAKPGEDHAVDLPLFNAGHVWGVKLGEINESDAIFGMGLGDIGSEHMGEHVSYYFVFQRVAVDEKPDEPTQPSEHAEVVRHIQAARTLLDEAERLLGGVA